MLPVVPGPPLPSSPPTADVRRPRHPQPVDAETELRGSIRNIEFKVLMYTQLVVLNDQRLRDFDTVVLTGRQLLALMSAKFLTSFFGDW
jgi:hypothetical protein